MLKAVIFDLDGVLSDSEGLYQEATSEILKGFGVSISQSELLSFRGLNSILAWETLAERYSLPAAVGELLKMEQEYVDTLIEKGSVSPVPFAFAFLKSLKEDGLKTAVATSNFGYRASLVFKQCNAEALVDALVSCEDVENSKPAPDTFLLAASRLGENPEDCIVIEDSLIGVKSAKNAGMKVVLFAPEKIYDEDFDADLVLYSFEGVTSETLRKCFSFPCGSEKV